MIVRAANKNKYTTIHNDVLGDERLSFKARGLLVYILSKPDHWQVRESQLANASDVDGVTAVRSGLNELKECGYIVNERKHDEDGQFYWESTVYDYPQVGLPSTENPPMENLTLVNTDIVNTDLAKTEVVLDVAALPQPIKANTKSTPVLLFREFAHRYPNHVQQQMIDAVVTEEDIEEWRRVLVEWFGRGYSPVNVKGMLDAFRNGLTDYTKARGRASNVQAGQDAADALRQRLIDNGMEDILR